ncbi:MAG TPA: cbb3-type cytochrome c oxidase subunit II [Burkholderiaceae bacterium]|nr:cbb3-type cytochrome c oxidase subunit II [Burkholderiaceae bacterium]
MNQLVAIAGGSTLVYAALALMMGVIPGYQLSHTLPAPGVQPLTSTEAAGRDVYVANGCGYCHTQQVRPLPGDKVFGRPSVAGDYAYQTPELLGSERTGPDLINVGARQPSEVWQYIHLYQPRAVVPQSIMPSFPWLFEVVDLAPPGVAPVAVPKAFAPASGVVIPGPQAQALVAYLLSLKQVPLPGASEAPAASSPSAAAPAPAQAQPTGGGADTAHGQELYVANCAACHQAGGQGLPGAFPPLKGDPVVGDADATEHLRAVLFGLQGKTINNVKYGSPMPPWAQLSDQDIAAIIDYERSSWDNHGKSITAAEVAAVRAKGK